MIEPTVEPTPNPEDSLEALRERLLAQRNKRRETLAKHKRTTHMAIESAKRGGTTYLDPIKLQEELRKYQEEQDEAPAAD